MRIALALWVTVFLVLLFPDYGDLRKGELLGVAAFGATVLTIAATLLLWLWSWALWA